MKQSVTTQPRNSRGKFLPSHATELRRQRVLEMRKAGLSYRVIAKQENVSRRQIIYDFNKAVEEAACGRQITTHTERSLELQRLEMALVALISRVREGDLASIDRWLRLCESRRRLLGLDMKPTHSLKTATRRHEEFKTYINLDLDKI